MRNSLVYPLFFFLLMHCACGEAEQKQDQQVNISSSRPESKLFVQQLDGGVLLRCEKGSPMHLLYETASKGDTLVQVVIDGVFFAEGSSQLDVKRSEKQLAEIAMLISSFPSHRFLISASTTAKTSEEENLRLSKIMARAMANALVENGADGSILDVQGMGEEKLSDSGSGTYQIGVKVAS